MADITYRIATADDAPALAALGARTFRDAFGADNTPENLAAHLAATYGESRQRAELADPACEYVVAEHAGTIIGFALLHASARAPAGVPPAACNLARLYVDGAWHRRGVGQGLMREARQRARGRGAAHLWLTVWERNARSIRFYLRQGYRDVGATPFFVGADRQTDRVMVLDLGGDGAP
jgi:diamine N-acetyltransferase